jgi:transcriptional regulator with XRE-family HTH domain
VSCSIGHTGRAAAVRIEEIVGERVRAKREELRWSQAELGERLGKHLGAPWSRQSVSAAEKGKRAFPVAEMIAFARVLDVTISYLLMPPANIDTVEMAPGVVAESAVIMRSTLPFKGTDGSEEKQLETAGRFLRHLLELKELTATVQGDIDDYALALQEIQAVKDYLGGCILADEAVRVGMVADGETTLAAPYGGLVSANRSTLAKMRELEQS